MTPWSRAQLAQLLHTWRAGGVEHYDIGALDHESDRMSLRGPWPLHQVMRACGWMAARNATGSSLYARPAHSLESHSWILVDGLNEASLAKLDELTPAGVVVEISPGSLQAWVRTKPSQDERTRTAIGRYLARTVGAANPEAAGGSAFGRIPGATNRKPALQRPDKLFPFTALRRAAPHGFTEYRALEGKLEPSDWPESVALATERPTARPADTKRDFAVACRLVESGHPHCEIAAALRAIRNYAPGEHAGYIRRTIEAARGHVGTGPN